MYSKIFSTSKDCAKSGHYKLMKRVNIIFHGISKRKLKASSKEWGYRLGCKDK